MSRKFPCGRLWINSSTRACCSSEILPASSSVGRRSSNLIRKRLETASKCRRRRHVMHGRAFPSERIHQPSQDSDPHGLPERDVLPLGSVIENLWHSVIAVSPF